MTRELALVMVLVGAGCSSHSPAGGKGGSGGSGGGVGGVGPGDGGGPGGPIEGGGGSGGSDGGIAVKPTSFPIDHIIVVVKENHTFDNYFSNFPNAESTNFAQTSTGPVAMQHAPLQLTRDLCHTHDCALADWNGGAMDHWDLGDTQNATDHLAFSQYYEADIPNYWQYARHFSLADHFHASMLGPSFPGHMFFLAAQTGWALGNPTGGLIFWGCDQTEMQDVQDQVTCMTTSVKPCYEFPTVVSNLPPAITWKFYGSALPPGVGEIWSMFDAVDKIRNGPDWKLVVADSQFDSDVDNGTLPNISFLVDQDLASEHPPLNICTGENWTVNHLNHVMAKTDLWNRTAILMSWDDFGGWYDHVAPPKQYGCDPVHPYGMGFRLPLIIVSPYVKPGTVYHNVAQQASVPKFIETIFGLPSLNSLDPAAQDGPDTDDLTAAFDFTQTPSAPLPLTARTCTGQR